MTNPPSLVITGLGGYFILNFLQKSGYFLIRITYYEQGLLSRALFKNRRPVHEAAGLRYLLRIYGLCAVDKFYLSGHTFGKPGK